MHEIFSKVTAQISHGRLIRIRQKVYNSVQLLLFSVILAIVMLMLPTPQQPLLWLHHQRWIYPHREFIRN